MASAHKTPVPEREGGIASKREAIGVESLADLPIEHTSMGVLSALLLELHAPAWGLVNVRSSMPHPAPAPLLRLSSHATGKRLLGRRSCSVLCSAAVDETKQDDALELGDADKASDQGDSTVDAVTRMLGAIFAALTSKKSRLACAIGTCADLVAQVIAGARVISDWVPRQTVAMAIWSLCYTGATRPLVDKQFDKICGSGSSTRHVLSKQALELFAFKPAIHVPALYMVTGMLAGKGFAGSLAKLCKVYKSTMLFSWALWPAPLWYYFKSCPQEHKVLFYSLIAFIQKCGFSYLSLPGKR